MRDGIRQVLRLWSYMGKGDKKTKRGKIFAGSYGKSRPKPNKNKKHKGPAEDGGAKPEEKKKSTAKAAEKKPVVKKAAAKKKAEKEEPKEEKKEAAQEEE